MKKKANSIITVIVSAILGALGVITYTANDSLDQIFKIDVRNKKTNVDKRILRVIDGDTFEIRISNMPEELKWVDKLSLRLEGIDTPEKGARAQCQKESDLARQATNFAKDKIDTAKTIEVRMKKWDKYGGRVLGEIFIDGAALSALMIKSGYARPYDGGKKQSWCS